MNTSPIEVYVRGREGSYEMYARTAGGATVVEPLFDIPHISWEDGTAGKAQGLCAHILAVTGLHGRIDWRECFLWAD